MKVLLAALNPPRAQKMMGGVASWISTVSPRLSKLGCPVSVWGPGDRLHKGVKFDLGIIANSRRTSIAAGFCDHVINVTHGIVPDEKPEKIFRLAATSEEVRDFWNVDATVIRQPIDLDFWRPVTLRKKVLTFYSYRAPEDFGLEIAAEIIGLEFRWVKNVDQFDARSALQESAVVCASGRAALEAMACGAPTLICDWRDYNGSPLLCYDLHHAMTRNYSGRGGAKPDASDIAYGALLAMEMQNPRAHVERHHDADAITKEILSLV